MKWLMGLVTIILLVTGCATVREEVDLVAQINFAKGVNQNIQQYNQNLEQVIV